MYLIVGLGNPGIQYQDTRHNVGFRAIDELGKDLGIGVSKKKFKALIGEGSLINEKIILLKPQTYMNLSGESVYQAVSWYKIPLTNLLVIYDDIDLPLGKIRIRPKGGAGTHNGMKSILNYLQSEDFPRIRIGIGKPLNERISLENYVLSTFLPEEFYQIEIALKNVVGAVKMIIQSGIEAAMNKYN